MRVVKTFPEVELYWLLNGKGSFPKKEKATNAPTSLSHFDSVVDTKSETLQANKNEEDKTSDDIERIVIFYKNGSFKSYKAE
jgi:hypothetical protein